MNVFEIVHSQTIQDIPPASTKTDDYPSYPETETVEPERPSREGDGEQGPGSEPARVLHAKDVLFIPDIPAVNEADCVSCEAYLNGWCLVAKPNSQYNIRFLRACPKESK